MLSDTRDRKANHSFITLLKQSQQRLVTETVVALKKLTKAEVIAQHVFSDARTRVIRARELLDQYDQICQRLPSCASGSRTEAVWDKGGQTIEKVVGRQAWRAKQDVHHLLHGRNIFAEEVSTNGRRPEEEEDLWRRFTKTATRSIDDKTTRDRVDGWGMIAKRMGRGIQRIVKDLPEDSE